ncbi:MAG TPA: PLP-dependent aminotransferase family protein, partial [Bacilli bacterium]|nr:PLP-dependent aminotransferase family protein [Bacilli bacterium]
VMEGYLKAKAKSGFYVEPYDHPLIGSFLKTKALIKEKTLFDYQWAFQTNVIDESFFPHALWGKLVRETLNSQKVGINQFDKQGLEELRLEIAKYLKNFRGIICRPEQIVVGSGTESLLALLIPLLGTTLHYGMENPGYPKISQFFRNWDLLFSYVNLDDHGLRVEELSKKQIDVVHVTPSHQFPMGIVMPLQRRLELLNWAKLKEKRFIIEDDYDSEFRYLGQPIPALSSLDGLGKVIYMNSFSKSLAPSLRISYMVLPEALLQVFLERFSYHSSSVPYFEQWVLAKFMEGGHFERHLNRMRKVYKNRLSFFQKVFGELGLDECFLLQGYDAGLHFLMTTKKATEEALIKAAEKVKIKVLGLSEFTFQEANYPTSLVIGYSGLNEEQIKTALTKLKTPWALCLTKPDNMIE